MVSKIGQNKDVFTCYALRIQNFSPNFVFNALYFVRMHAIRMLAVRTVQCISTPKQYIPYQTQITLVFLLFFTILSTYLILNRIPLHGIGWKVSIQNLVCLDADGWPGVMCEIKLSSMWWIGAKEMDSGLCIFFVSIRSFYMNFTRVFIV